MKCHFSSVWCIRVWWSDHDQGQNLASWNSITVDGHFEDSHIFEIYVVSICIVKLISKNGPRENFHLSTRLKFENLIFFIRISYSENDIAEIDTNINPCVIQGNRARCQSRVDSRYRFIDPGWYWPSFWMPVSFWRLYYMAYIISGLFI